MKLRKITLKGFKTFPRKTEIEYKEGINIIIGPNGSGKSNIVDAVKWALGEKSIKSLRGGNMDDVIFKGNDQGMLPSNFASVSMIFDNQDRKLRLDVDEVEIERAFSKDKASKFMINKKRAKLKEIVSLFADTGITSNSYAIIEQGKINNLLLSSSQEKRVIFEEAAGVMNEKFEKIETERKLDRAGENLQRIDDIIEEKDKHYGSLKRAVSKYNRYLQFKDNLNEKKRRYNGLNYLHFKEELEKFDEKRNPLFLKKAALLKEVSQLESELAELDLAITNIWESHSSASDKKQTITTEIGKAENEKILLQQENTNKKETIKEHKKRISENEDRKKRLSENITTWKNDVKEKKEELITLSNESKKLDNDYEIAQKDLDDILKNNKEIEDIYLNFSGQLTDIQNQRIQVSSEKSSKENQLEQTKTRLSNFDKKLALFNADYEASLKDRDRMQEKLDLEDEEEEKLNEELKTTIREYDEYKDRYGKTSVIVETITQNMKLLSDSLEKYSGYGSGVKNVMNKAKLRDEKALSGIHDVVANLIDFSSNTAHALEIAFGGVLQYIVVDSEADAKRAISYLNRIRGGRVTFLPIDSEKSRGKPFELPLLGGIVGWATELYSAQKVYKDIIDRFIRNVIIVKDMNVASELKQKIRGKNFRITTLAGEVFYSDGRIIGGKRERESGLLTLKNKLTTLEENLNDKKVELNELEEEFQKRFKRKDEIEKKKIEIQKRRRNLNLELDKYKEECITIGNNIKNAVENKSIEEETVDILTDQIKESTKKLNSIDKIYEGINSDNEEIKKKYEKFNKKVTEKNNEIIDIKTNIQGNEAQIKLCNSEIENLTSSIQNYDQLTEEIEGDIKFYKQEIGSFKKAIEQNTITIKKIVDKIAGISQKLEGSEEVIGKLSEEIDKKNKKKEGKNITIKEKREKLEEITDELEEFQNGKNDISVKAELYYEHLNELFDDNDDIVEYLDEIENVTDIEITNANEEINIISGKIERLGPINFEAVEEFDRFKEEYELLKENYNDIADSIEKLKDIIISVNKDIAEKFSRTIENINRHFDKTFKAMFEGGEATVIMLSPEDPLETGVDIQVKLPGKNIEVLSLTSGGEKALIAASLIFAIFLQNPSPVCILDEVDASMDAANIEKFFKMIKKFSSEIQFIVITHNKKSMEFADTLYGVTMEQKGVSKILSVHFKNKKNNDDIL